MILYLITKKDLEIKQWGKVFEDAIKNGGFKIFTSEPIPVVRVPKIK